MTELRTLLGVTHARYREDETHRWPYLFGVELELEDVPRDEDGEHQPIDGWSRHEDASLRNGIEYVTRGPKGGEDLVEVLDSFYGYGLEYTAGPRTGTHIHINMSDSTVEELRTMIAVVYTIEDALFSCVGEARKWAGYSVALTEMNPKRLRNLLNSPTNAVFIRASTPQRNNERYYGLNCNVGKHGTAEFRHFPGGPTREELESWLDLVTCIKRVSERHTVSSLSASVFSPESLRDFLENNFGPWAGRLLAAVSAETMLTSFDTVMAMAMDEDNSERSGGVVFTNQALLLYVGITLLRGNVTALHSLVDSLPPGGVLSEHEFGFRLERARNIARGDGEEITYNRTFVTTSTYGDPYPADEEPYESEDYEVEEEEEEELPPEEATSAEREWQEHLDPLLQRIAAIQAANPREWPSDPPTYQPDAGRVVIRPRVPSSAAAAVAREQSDIARWMQQQPANLYQSRDPRRGGME